MRADRAERCRVPPSVVVLVSLFFGICACVLEGDAAAKQLYSYRDEKGTNVITDNYDRIPAQYRAKAIVVEQEEDSAAPLSRGVGGLLKGVDKSIGQARVDVPGMTPYQSHALTVAGSLALLCLALRNFSRSQVIRFLSLWGLVMLGLMTPVLIYFSQDGPLDLLRGQASKIQTKQLDHLKHAP